MIKWWKEIVLVFRQSVRMLFRNFYIIILILLGTVLLGAMLFCMDTAKEEKSKIAVGIADEDGSAMSCAVVKKMSQMELYLVVTGEEKALTEQLQAGKLSAVCVLKDGFEKDVQRGKTSNLVTIYETKEQNAPLFGDILAGAMMQEICMAKGHQKLLDYEEKTGREIKTSAAEYQQYIEKLLSENDIDFSFEITYVDAGKRVEQPTAAMLYEQAVFAVFALMLGLLSVYAVLPFRSFRHGRLAERLQTVPLSQSAVYLGSALGALVIPLIFSICFLSGFCIKNKMGILHFLSILICTLVYICVIVGMMLMIAYGIHSQTVYQTGMLAMILVFGVLGLVSLVDGLLLPEGVCEWIPNGWYVRQVIELLHQ